MKRILLLILMSVTLLCFAGCGSQEPTGDGGSGIRFTDDLGNEVVVNEVQRVGIASGSLVDCWQLAGGQPAAVTEDVLEEEDAELPENVISIGFLREPSLEKIIEADLDFVILMGALDSHVSMSESLTNAGIPHAYFDMETFDDYLNVMDIFTDITGRKDLYEQNGTALVNEIDTIIQSGRVDNEPKVLIIRTSSSRISVQDSDTMVGTMLKDLGCVNIADNDVSILEELSLESIIQEDPDYIFVTFMGSEAEAKAQLDNLFASNPAWDELSAVKEQKYFILDKELFHEKPNVRWGESYEILAEILSEH